MRQLMISALTGLTFIGSFGHAQTGDELTVLFDAIQMPQMITIMRQEGLDYGETLGAELIPGGGQGRWDSAVSDIYDADVMTQAMRDGFQAAIGDTDLTPIIAFYTSEPGSTIVGLEVSAREALLDPEIEAASKDAAQIARMDGDPRLVLVDEFIAANDLIEQNVVGSMNSSYAFYLGLMDGGVSAAGMTPETALRDVWAQEPDIRQNTIEWAQSFLLMAYQPLSDDDLRSYITFSQTQAGQDLNNALFFAFNGMFDDISRSLGLAASSFMISQEL